MGKENSKISEEERRIEIIKEEEHIRKVFSAYSSIKNFLIKYIYGEKIISLPQQIEVFLISTKSIPNFIDILKNEFKEKVSNEEELKKVEIKLRESFKEYKIEKNVIIYNSYQQCLNAMNNENDNEFMIVDENFVNTFEIKEAIYKKVIIVQLNNYKHSMVIKFPASQIEINAEEKKDKKGYFRFINKIEKNEDNINSVEIMPINNNHQKIENGNKKHEIYFSMVQSIVYCLLSIKSFKDDFSNKEEKLYENKYFSRLFYNIINNKENKNNNFIELAEYLNSYYYFEPEVRIEYIYKILHDELKNIKENHISRIINQSINNPDPDIEIMNASYNFQKNGISIISDIFYYQNITTFKCQNCQKIVLYKSNINNHIIFPLKLIKFNYSRDNLNIYDCFDWLISDKNESMTCQMCNNSVKSFYRLNSTKEILTIILDRGKNFEDGIFFELDFNINLRKYFFNGNKDENYILKGFCSYFKDENKCFAFCLNDEDQEWYYFNGSTFNRVLGNDQIGAPFLLFYQRK